MSAKNMDHQGRWRSVTVAFRVSPEEDALIESAVRISGCTKQDYIIKKLTDQSVVVQGNPKVYRGLKLEMRQILTELKRIGTGEDVSRDLLDRITSVMGGMKDAKDG
ncbi:MAG: hypothetical protein IJJ06_10165 [Mogibacterium sp.]|nr:hypothetical protein [Mogibacterium sp.]